MDKHTRQKNLLRSKYLRQLTEIMDKHSISIEELTSFQETYKPVSVQMKERRERKLAEQRHKQNLEKARKALAEKRRRKQNGK